MTVPFRFSVPVALGVVLAACGGSTVEGPAAPTDGGPDGTTDSALPPPDGGPEGGDDAVADAGSDSGGRESGPEIGPSGCITDTTPGTHVFDCDGFKYDVTVAPTCPGTGCGLILDVHGATMSGKMEDNNTNLRALGSKNGYLVIQPNANPKPPTSSWNPTTDDPKVHAFLLSAIDVFAIDKKRVHMTGFSQGGMMSSRFLCKHADLFASVAPAAGTGCTFTGADTPSRELDVLYLHGTSDALVAFSLGTAQRDALVAAWKMGTPTVVASDSSYKWSRWTNPSGTTFEFIQHDYQASSFVLKGHCYPGSTDKGGEPGQLFPFACTAASPFVWGEVVMKFFMDHPRK